MYKHSSPEALSLASLGRADSKRPDKTCRGITTAGKPCRKALKKGSREKYCYFHRDQQSTYRSRLLGARATIVEEYEDENTDESRSSIAAAYPTPAPSPSTPLRKSPRRKPVPSITFPAKQSVPHPSFQLSTPQSIAPPSPPLSIRSTKIDSTPQPQKNGLFKLGGRIRNIFRPNTRKPKLSKAALQYTPSISRTFQRNDHLGSRYPQIITPTSLPPSTPSISITQTPSNPIRGPPHQRNPQHLPPSPQRTPEQNGSNVPTLQGRPPTAVLAMAQSRTLTTDIKPRTGIQRSWETMWVPGIDGLGAHIICKEWLSPDLTAVGCQKLLSCMRAPLSTGEEPGYIYVYKISEAKPSNDGVFYKVGRAQNLTRRLYQWSRSCPYTPLLVEFFPTPPTGTLRRTPSASSISSLFRRERTPPPTPPRVVMCSVTHRVERLIHLELEDRFGRVDISGEGCQCGKIHKEWFHGGNGGQGGWAEVRDVIVRWVGFARIAYGEAVV